MNQKNQEAKGVIIFVHGFMSTGAPWIKWCNYFETLGYECYAPHWPYHDRSIRELQESPDPRLANTNFRDVLDHYITFIRSLNTISTPILIGHSLGGVIVQRLLQEGYGKAAVCINSGPPKGIVAMNWDFLWSNLQLLNPLSRKKTCLMSPQWYHRYVCNEMKDLIEVEAIIREHCVPASKKVAQTIAEYGAINFSLPHRPYSSSLEKKIAHSLRLLISRTKKPIPM